MEILVKSDSIENLSTSCLVIFVPASHDLSQVEYLKNINCKMLTSVIEQNDLNKKLGSTLFIPVPLTKTIKRVMLVSIGTEPLSLETTFDIIDTTVNALAKLSIADVALCLEGLKNSEFFYWHCKYLSQTLIESTYKFNYFTKNKEKIKLKKALIIYSNPTEISNQINVGIGIGEGMNAAKELGNMPGNVCTPSWLESKAKDFVKNNKKFSINTLNEKDMAKLNMNSFLSVAKGSDEPAKLIVIEYKNSKPKDAPHVLLGKGITFDSGGISLKPGARMDEMKYDMCGAASVMGVMHMLAKLQPSINVIGVIASAENMPSGKASKPGDVVTSMSGKTIEILNTDAEGRLVLCDALTYIEKFKPKDVIDIATLTGACIVALGHHTSGLISNNKDLSHELVSLSQLCKDTVWELPTGKNYDKQLESNFADLANIGGPSAGTITAGCFLQKFATTFRWAHLDIAGTAWKSGKEKGATGRPVALLSNYLLSKSQ